MTSRNAQREAKKQAQAEQRARVRGGDTDVHVFRAGEETVEAHAERVYHQPYAAGVLDPVVLPVHVVEDGIAPGVHEVQFAVEHYLCRVDSEGRHHQEPYTLVVRTSLTSFLATAQRCNDDASPGKHAEIPFALDLWEPEEDD